MKKTLAGKRARYGFVTLPTHLLVANDSEHSIARSQSGLPGRSIVSQNRRRQCQDKQEPPYTATDSWTRTNFRNRIPFSCA
ncbi:MAG: hypothetical protein FD165_1056 [Gammaproteobacteria bacterium]|nr:MAG: hypothetical protein FD165_1056 [Gammaproteobacteria bacterium]TND06236.1 MAG: hypothetical protein FD120_723 [Gammaproteobacteria bacterium]